VTFSPSRQWSKPPAPSLRLHGKVLDRDLTVGERVPAGVAEQLIRAHASLQHVVLLAATDDVVPSLPVDPVPPPEPEDDIVFRGSVDDVGPLLPKIVPVW
jgi:hypothetical protein